MICTHLHFDHVGWNTMLVDGAVGADVPERALPAVPRRVGALERGRVRAGTGYAATIDDAVRPVIDAGLADLVPSDHRVTDEIRLEATPGHTPGHVAVHVESGGEHALITGDLAHHPVQFAEPDWFADPDTDREQSSATRRRLLAEHGDTDVLVIGTHFAPPCSGHLSPSGNGYRSRRLHRRMPDRPHRPSPSPSSTSPRSGGVPPPPTRCNNSIELVQETERLGYRRHWVAEHHNMPGIASSSPPVLLAHLASVTSTIRLGSGGVMLPNHSALTVAEQFGMLEALHPGRIDLGIGRAPGTDQLTAAALRRGARAPRRRRLPRADDRAPRLLRGRAPRGPPRTSTSPRCPRAATSPRSGCSGRAPTARRPPPCSACRSRSRTTSRRPMLDDALDVYRRNFRPSAELDAPYVMLGVSVICGETDEHAHRLGQAGPARVPPAPPGTSRRLPERRRGRGVQLHARRAPVRRRLDPLARHRRRGDGARPASRSWSSAPASTSSWCRRWRRPTTSGWRRTAASPTRSRSAPPADRTGRRPQRPHGEDHAHRGDAGVRHVRRRGDGRTGDPRVDGGPVDRSA